MKTDARRRDRLLSRLAEDWVRASSSVELTLTPMMLDAEDEMGNDAEKADKIDELASNLDDLKTVVDELADDPSVDQGAVKTLKKALREADGATEILEDDLEGR